MEIKQYIAIVLRWLWLLILGLILGASSAYFFSSRQQRIYQSSTRVQVMSAPMSGSNNYSYYMDAQLASTYIETMKTRPIMDEVGKQLGISVSSGQITARVVPNTQLIDITVQDTDAQRAADIANKLVEVFAAKNNESQASRFQESEQSLQEQIQQIDTQIQTLQTQSSEVSSAQTKDTLTKAETEIKRLEGEILKLQAEIDTLSNPVGKAKLSPTPTISPENRNQLNEKQLRLTQLQNTYNLYQQIYTNLVVLGNNAVSASNTAEKDKLQSTLALYEQIRANLLASYENVRLSRLNSTANIVQIEPASVNPGPIRPQTTRDTGMGGAVGLLLAAGIVFVIEYLDDTLKTAEQITAVLGLPVIGFIADMEHKKDLPYVAENPRSPVSESFRTLRANLEFASVDQPLITLLVVSAHPAEGKSTIAANLAVTYAQGGKHVLLIDADLRRPRIHTFFGLSNRVGLSDMFRSSPSLVDVINKWKDTSLAIVTSGGIPPNPADLLSSKKMADVLVATKKVADVVIVDSPPFLVSDASILASHVDGVLLVINPGKTPFHAALTTLEQMKRAGAHVVGVVMNRIPRNRAYYYGGYRYNSHYYQDHYSYSYDDSPRSKKTGLAALFKSRFGKSKKVTHESDTPIKTTDE